MGDQSGNGFTLHYLRSVSEEFETTRGFASLEEVVSHVRAESMPASCDEAYATGPDGETIDDDLLGPVSA